jgi:ATP phosphoribosyltransferase
MNAPADRIEEIIAILPSLKNPTVSHLYKSDWVSIESILPEKQVRQIIPALIKIGAQGIVEYPLSKII